MAVRRTAAPVALLPARPAPGRMEADSLSARTPHPAGEAQRARWGHRAGTSVRCDRRAHHDHLDQRAAYARRTWGVETMCVGGGQGMAMVLERLG